MRLRPGHIFTAKVALFFLLLLALIVQSGRLFTHTQWGKLDLTGQHVGSLSKETRSFLDAFSGKIGFTYFVTPDVQMPAHLKGVVAPTLHLLDVLQKFSPDKITYRILDPDQSGELSLQEWVQIGQ